MGHSRYSWVTDGLASIANETSLYFFTIIKMGLFDSDASSNGKPVNYIQIKTKGLPEPLFQIVSKDTWAIATVKSIDGNITGIQYTENEFDGNKIKGYRITFDAPDGVGLLSLGFTSLGRSIFNSLLSLVSAENVKISLYKNKKGYDAVSVTQNGEKVGWALDMKDPNLTPVVVKDAEGNDVLVEGKKIIKWEKVVSFLIDEINKKFTGFKFATQSNNFVSPAHDEPNVDTHPIPAGMLDDLPENEPFTTNAPE